MEPVLFAWADLIIHAIEVIALGAILWELLHLRRDAMAMLRVLRRLDRKASEPATSGLKP
jgi:hypothetical protein